MFEQQLVKAFANPPAGRLIPYFTVNRQCFCTQVEFSSNFHVMVCCYRTLCLNLETFWLIQCSVCGKVTILFVILTPQAPKESTEYGDMPFTSKPFVKLFHFICKKNELLITDDNFFLHKYLSNSLKPQSLLISLNTMQNFSEIFHQVPK